MKLTNKQRAEVITDFTAGKTKSEIARKFNVSPNAISKILSRYKSSMEQEKVQESSIKVQKSDNKELARDIYNRAMEGLKERVSKATPTELLKIIEYYNLMYNFAEEGSDEKVTSIAVTVEDGSGEDGTKD